MPGMKKDKVKKPTAMKMMQMRNGKETMKKKMFLYLSYS